MPGLGQGGLNMGIGAKIVIAGEGGQGINRCMITEAAYEGVRLYILTLEWNRGGFCLCSNIR